MIEITRAPAQECRDSGDLIIELTERLERYKIREYTLAL